MMVFHIFALLTAAIFGGWEEVEWAIGSSICDSLVRVFWNI